MLLKRLLPPFAVIMGVLCICGFIWACAMCIDHTPSDQWHVTWVTYGKVEDWIINEEPEYLNNGWIRFEAFGEPIRIIGDIKIERYLIDDNDFREY